MDKEMETIIKRQQEYERLGRMPLSVILDKRRNIGITDGYVAGMVLPELRKMSHRKRMESRYRICILILTILCMVFLMVVMGVILVSVYLSLGGYLMIIYI